ncbi:MAG: rod shape-determining protein MreC [Candidatus Omnitrophica bacterium]|nr:rod shape-determining protein MreC [Candidatus Omnitrophota bacterium]
MISRRIIKNIAYVIILLVPFFLFFSRNKVFQDLKLKMVGLSAGPVRLISVPFKEAKKILYYHRTFEEYKRLNREVNTLKNRLVGLEEALKENTRLERLLKFQRNQVYSSVVANVIGRNPSYWNSAMIIDKGSLDGIRQGFPVVDSAGVVGKVAEVGPKTSKVILLTDPEFSAAALVQESRESGLVSGTLRGLCRMKYMNPGADIQVGNKIITSKLSSSFPEGLLIGQVVEISSTSKDLAAECVIEPAVSLSQLEEVLVIVK